MKIDDIPMEKDAKISPCKKFRYHLTRIWDPNGKKLFVIGLNCSTADHKKNDPTVRREIMFARDWGYGGLLKGNLFAYRTKDPKEMKKAEDPIGPENDMWISMMAAVAEKIVIAWGAHGGFMGRDRQVLKLLDKQRLWCLGTTQDGFPRHPLYVEHTTPLVEWKG